MYIIFNQTYYIATLRLHVSVKVLIKLLNLLFPINLTF